MIRNYSQIDLLRFKNFSQLPENLSLKPIELIEAYNKKYPELTSKQKLINLSKALNINNLHKELTGKDITDEDLVEWGYAK